MNPPGTTAIPDSFTLKAVTAPVPVPDNAVTTSNTDCGYWYTIQDGDTCDRVSEIFFIPENDFYFLNPQLDNNCAYLLLGNSYCVQAVGSIQTYSGYSSSSSTSFPVLSSTVDANTTVTENRTMSETATISISGNAAASLTSTIISPSRMSTLPTFSASTAITSTTVTLTTSNSAATATATGLFISPDGTYGGTTGYTSPTVIPTTALAPGQFRPTGSAALIIEIIHALAPSSDRVAVPMSTVDLPTSIAHQPSAIVLTAGVDS
ncbi:hypothetical protein ABHI18_012097 [Aspergillus niger]